MPDRSLPVRAVYGPVSSWRFGRSLGIDPIGKVSTCSFNCVYCQLGEIENVTDRRQIFVSTDQIERELLPIDPDAVDVVTVSGSGEPTLASNLEEILAIARAVIDRPTVVLTNSTMLHDREVCNALAAADTVAAKLDAVTKSQFKGVSRPVPQIELSDIARGLMQFRQDYTGHLAIQTMLLAPWSEAKRRKFIHYIQQIHPDEIQINTPTRPQPLTRQLDARGNHQQSRPYATHSLQPVESNLLSQFAAQLQRETLVPVRYVPL
ncbi:MAG: radical SAM protein [Synechococcus sp.]